MKREALWGACTEMKKSANRGQHPEKKSQESKQSQTKQQKGKEKIGGQTRRGPWPSSLPFLLFSLLPHARIHRRCASVAAAWAGGGGVHTQDTNMHLPTNQPTDHRFLTSAYFSSSPSSSEMVIASSSSPPSASSSSLAFAAAAAALPLPLPGDAAPSFSSFFAFLALPPPLLESGVVVLVVVALA